MGFMPRAKKSAPAPVVAATPEIPVPVGPSPAVLELQSDIVALVRERSSYRKRVLEIQAALFKAQSDFQTTQAALNQYEQEIAERMNVIAQLENRPAQTHGAPPVLSFPQPNLPLNTLDMAGISAESSRPDPYAQDPGDLVNRSRITRNEAAAIRASL